MTKTAKAYPPPESIETPMRERTYGGVDLVVDKHDPLADVCLKCGKTHGLLRRSVNLTETRPYPWSWGGGLVLMAVGAILTLRLGVSPSLRSYLFAPALAFLLLSRYARTVPKSLPLCSECNATWDRGRIQVIVGVLVAIVGFVVGNTLAPQYVAPRHIMLVAFVAALPGVAIVTSASKAFIVLRWRIDSRLHLAGLSPKRSST
jgi:hypothetical protein